MTVNWERDLPDMSLPEEGETPATDGPVVAYLRGLLLNGDVARATKVVVIAAYVDGEGDEHIGRFFWGVSVSEQLGLVAYQHERLRRFVVGAEEDS